MFAPHAVDLFRKCGKRDFWLLLMARYRLMGLSSVRHSLLLFLLHVGLLVGLTFAAAAAVEIPQ
jgi:hypothetical protein